MNGSEQLFAGNQLRTVWRSRSAAVRNSTKLFIFRFFPPSLFVQLTLNSEANCFTLYLLYSLFVVCSRSLLPDVSLFYTSIIDKNGDNYSTLFTTKFLLFRHHLSTINNSLATTKLPEARDSGFQTGSFLSLVTSIQSPSKSALNALFIVIQSPAKSALKSLHSSLL